MNIRSTSLALTAAAVVALAGCGQESAQKQAAAPTPTGPAPAQTADSIYAGGDIVTMNDAQPIAEAVAVKDGKILAVGARADIEKAHKGTGTQIVDLGGKTLMPSFIDAHCHYINSLLVANQAKLYAPPAGPGKDVDSIVAALKTVRRGPQDPEGRDDHGLRLRRDRHARRPPPEPRRPRQGVPGQPGPRRPRVDARRRC